VSLFLYRRLKERKKEKPENRGKTIRFDMRLQKEPPNCAFKASAVRVS